MLSALSRVVRGSAHLARLQGAPRPTPPAGSRLRSRNASTSASVAIWGPRWRTAHDVTGERNAELLNWKFDLDGRGPYPSSKKWPPWTPATRWTGYIVYRVKDGVRHVFDLACTDSKRMIDALLAEFVADARREGAVGVTFLCLGSLGLLEQRPAGVPVPGPGRGQASSRLSPPPAEARRRPAPAGELVLRHGRRRLLAWAIRRRFGVATPPRPGYRCCPRRRAASGWRMRGWRRR